MVTSTPAHGGASKAHDVAVIGGVDDPRRLAAVVRADMHGHLGDPELNAVVATLQISCTVPIVVVNMVTQNTQTYPAEVGIGTPCTTISDAMSFCAAVVDAQSPIVVTNAREHPVYAHNPLVVDGLVCAYAGVPLVDDGFVLGTVAIFDNHPRQFTDRELELLEHQARLASSVLELRRTSRTDALTGLPNRTLFLDRLTRSLKRLERHDGLVGVMFLDIDGFKVLNDSRGHEVGDRVLVELAHRLTEVLRATDTFARLGGDEFAALCEDFSAVEDVEKIAQRVVAAVDPPFILDGTSTEIGVSIGLVVTDSGADAPAELLRVADAAMYRAKRIVGSAWVREPGRPQAGMRA